MKYNIKLNEWDELTINKLELILDSMLETHCNVIANCEEENKEYHRKVDMIEDLVK